MMQFAHAHLAKAKGLIFYKLMGSGKGDGFDPWPDWSVYSLLMIWEDEVAATDFIDNSKLFSAYRKKTINTWTLYLKNTQAHGKWSGSNPFESQSKPVSASPRIAVITRATIRISKLRKFWQYVPTSSVPLADNPGLIFTKGIGEVPVLQMATFSLWQNEEALKQFAYQSKEHQKAIRMTRELDWYKEELFARFRVLKESGSWVLKNLNK